MKQKYVKIEIETLKKLTNDLEIIGAFLKADLIYKRRRAWRDWVLGWHLILLTAIFLGSFGTHWLMWLYLPTIISLMYFSSDKFTNKIARWR